MRIVLILLYFCVYRVEKADPLFTERLADTAFILLLVMTLKEGYHRKRITGEKLTMIWK
jgi:hypothetical protein